MRGSRIWGVPVSIVATLVVAVGAGGVAYAAVSQSDGVVRACVEKNGSIRVERECGRREFSLSFYSTAGADSRFMHGRIVSNHITLPNPSGQATLLELPGFGQITTRCSEAKIINPGTPQEELIIPMIEYTFSNTSSQPKDVFAGTDSMFPLGELAPRASATITSESHAAVELLVSSGLGQQTRSVQALVGHRRELQSGNPLGPCHFVGRAEIQT